jgi:integrase
VTEAEYLAIYNAGSELSQVVQELCFRTAQRIGDVRRIDESQLTEQGIYFEQGKTGAKVLVQWSPELRAVVERAKVLSGWSDNVVPLKGSRYLLQQRGGSCIGYDRVRKEFAAAVKATGIQDVRIHDMRAAAAGDVKAAQDSAGGSGGLQMAAQLLGHGENVKTTKRHYIRAEKRAVVVQGPTGRKVA